MGELASAPRQPERDRHAGLNPFAAATSFGNPLPERVVRAIVFARLAKFIEGPCRDQAAHRPRGCRDAGQRAAATVPGSGQGGAGNPGALPAVRRARPGNSNSV